MQNKTESTPKPTPESIREEIKKNFKYFSKQEPALAKDGKSGKFAIIRQCEIIEIMDTRNDAKKIAESRYKDGIYSIQQINPQKLDLGSIPHALRTN